MEDDDAEVARLATMLVLRSSCDRAQEGIVVHTSARRVYACRFAAVSGSGLTLDLSGDPARMRFSPLALVCVTFNTEGRSHVFLAHVRGFDPAAAPRPRLVLRLPDHITAAAARIATRVPVVESSGLVVVVTSGQRFREARAIDVSFSGILLGFEPEDDPDLEHDAEVTVSLSAGGQRAVLRARVRRRHGEEHGYGMVFPDAIHDGEVRPPDDLRAVMRVLEEALLRAGAT